MMFALAALACTTHQDPPPFDTANADLDGDGFSVTEGDCADADPSVHPGADDPPGDDIDRDCDGTTRSARSLAGLPSTVGPSPACDLLFGHALATGDLDGDGADEILVGSQEISTDCARGDGFAAVFDGPNLDPVAAWHGLDSSLPGSGGMRLGQTVALADVVSPVGPDIVLQSLQAIFILRGDDPTRGLDDAAVTIERPTNMALDAVVAAGDVTADALDDVLVNVWESDPDGFSVRILHGPLSGSRSLAESESTLADVWMHGVVVVDIDGDGTRDLAVGDASVGEDSGAVYVFAAPVATGTFDRTSAHQTFEGDSPRDWLGQRMTHSDDLDGDGTAEVVVTAMAWPGGERLGKVYTLDDGAVTLEDATFVVEGFDVIGGVDPVAHLGAGMASADLDDDGQADLALGAAAFGWNGADLGRVFLFFGPVSGDASAADADVIWMGEHRGDWAGSDLAAGDIDGNGTDDLVIGAPSADLAPGTEGSGRVYLLAGPIAP